MGDDLARPPPTLWLVLFLVVPYLALLVQSFLAADEYGNVVFTPTLGHYRDFFTKPVYYGTLLYTFETAAIVTVACVLLSVPLAYVIAFKVKRYKSLLYTLIIVPLWVSYIVRTYAWKIILGRAGILNTFLLYVHLVDKPVEAFLYSRWAVVVGLVHIFTPFVLMPIYTAFEHIPRPLLEASRTSARAASPPFAGSSCRWPCRGSSPGHLRFRAHARRFPGGPPPGRARYADDLQRGPEPLRDLGRSPARLGDWHRDAAHRAWHPRADDARREIARQRGVLGRGRPPWRGEAVSGRRADVVTWLLYAAAVLVFVFIYLPLLVVVVYSFNPESVNSFPMTGVSLRWYRVMVENASLMKALRVSVAIALGGR